MNLRFLTVITAGAIALSGAAFAAFTDVDADGDGVLSADEFVSGFPDATEEIFTATDLNADGAISEEEHAAAVDAGILPAE